MKRFNFKKKKGIVSEYLPWMIIAIAVLVILAFSLFIIKGQGVSVIDKLGALFRGR